MIKRNKIIILIIITVLLLAVTVPVTIQLKDHFFSTNYYESPLDAYNAECGLDAVYGDISAHKEIGVLKLDEENSLFLGELSQDVFILAEMSVKKNKYAYKGAVTFYDTDYKFDVNGYSQTETNSGSIKWIVAYDKKDLDKISAEINISKYVRNDGSDVYIAVYH